MKYLLALILCLTIIGAGAHAQSDGEKSPAEDTETQQKSSDEKAAGVKANNPQDPKLTEVLNKHYEATGGVENWDKIETMIIKGSLHSQGTAIPMQVTYKRPNKCKARYQLGEHTLVQSFNGNLAWQTNPLAGLPDPTLMPPEMIKYFTDNCYLDGPLINHEEKNNKIEYKGLEDIGKNQKAHKLLVSFNSGNIQTYYLDSESFLPVKMIGEYKIDEGDSRVTMLYSDYRKVNDVVVPYFMKNTIKGPETSEGIEIQTISFNENVPDNTFNAPMEVLFRDAQKIQPIPGPEKK